eukprot:2305156-Pleurochrysis_carterae.AAC.2
MHAERPILEQSRHHDRVRRRIVKRHIWDELRPRCGDDAADAHVAHHERFPPYPIVFKTRG